MTDRDALLAVRDQLMKLNFDLRESVKKQQGQIAQVEVQVGELDELLKEMDEHTSSPPHKQPNVLCDCGHSYTNHDTHGCTLCKCMRFRQ